MTIKYAEQKIHEARVPTVDFDQKDGPLLGTLESSHRSSPC
jgi:hypothetical protein